MTTLAHLLRISAREQCRNWHPIWVLASGQLTSWDTLGIWNALKSKMSVNWQLLCCVEAEPRPGASLQSKRVCLRATCHWHMGVVEHGSCSRFVPSIKVKHIQEFTRQASGFQQCFSIAQIIGQVKDLPRYSHCIKPRVGILDVQYIYIHCWRHSF